MLEGNKYIKDEEKLNKALKKLAYCRDIIDEIKKEFTYFDFTGMDGRDLKSMCYIFVANNPDISLVEFKEKSRGLMHDFLDGLSREKELTKEEKEARDIRIKPHLDMLFDFQAKYTEFMEAKSEDDYFKSLVYLANTQTFGVKKEENKKYFSERLNSLEKVKKNDAIDKFSVNYMFDITKEFNKGKVVINRYVDMTVAMGNSDDSKKFIDMDEAETEEAIEEARIIEEEYDREEKFTKAGLDAALREQKNSKYLEFDVINDMYDVAKTKITEEGLNNSKYSRQLIALSRNLVLKVVGDDTNEKSILNNLGFHNLYTKCIYLDGRPLASYVPDWVKNYDINDDGSIDANKKSNKSVLINRAMSVILLNAITKGDKRIDMVRFNSCKNEIGYDIQPIKFNYNQEEYEKANYGWLRRKIFRIGIKKIQKSFDKKFKDTSKQEERFALIEDDIKKTFENKDYSIRKIDMKFDGERKIVDELKNEINIIDNIIDKDNVKEIKKDELKK